MGCKVTEQQMLLTSSAAVHNGHDCLQIVAAACTSDCIVTADVGEAPVACPKSHWVSDHVSNLSSAWVDAGSMLHSASRLVTAQLTRGLCVTQGHHHAWCLDWTMDLVETLCLLVVCSVSNLFNAWVRRTLTCVWLRLIIMHGA